jgi:hypothetical protein
VAVILERRESASVIAGLRDSSHQQPRPYAICFYHTKPRFVGELHRSFNCRGVLASTSIPGAASHPPRTIIAGAFDWRPRLAGVRPNTEIRKSLGLGFLALLGVYSMVRLRGESSIHR